MAEKEGAGCSEAKGHVVGMGAACLLFHVIPCGFIVTLLSVMGRPDDLDGLSGVHDLHVFSKALQPARA